MAQSDGKVEAIPGKDAQEVGSGLGFDPHALKAKYRAERDKRLREDGRAHYVQIEGELTRYLDDPYVDHELSRAPITEEVEVVVIGAGFGGLLAGVRLREAGVENIRIIDKAGDFGGTWYWNRYPGIACDIESYCYIPMLEEVGYIPAEKYSRGEEILRYCRMVGEKYDLYRNACFQTSVTDMRWDDSISRWIVSTDRDDKLKARFVVMATGILERLKLPAIPGIETFKGHSFHSSRWDYSYTGGSAEEGLPKLADKRVGIIGTGASGVQCIPHLGQWARHLYVFQRTPSTIDVRGNRPTDPEWVKTLEPGWQKKRIDNFNQFFTGLPPEQDLVKDGWTETFSRLVRRNPPGAKGDLSPEAIAKLLELEDFKKMEELRARVDSIVRDQVTAEALKPYYKLFCKRPCFHDEYLDTFNRPNVTLVDTKGKGVERIREHGVVVAGKEYEIDCLIYATGFDFQAAYKGGSGYDVYGRDGVALSEKWKHGVSTLHGMHTRGFPNCIIMNVAQAGLTHVPHLLNDQSKHIAYIVTQCQKRRARTFEVTEEAENAWVNKIVALSAGRDKFLAECTPNDGLPVTRSEAIGAVEYVKTLEDWRSEGDLKGLELISD